MRVATHDPAAAAFLLGIRSTRAQRFGAHPLGVLEPVPSSINAIRRFAVPKLQRLGFVFKTLGLSMPESVLLQADEVIA